MWAQGESLEATRSSEQLSPTSDRSATGSDKYLRNVYSQVGHVYVSFIFLRLHFHQSLMAQFTFSGAFGCKEQRSFSRIAKKKGKTMTATAIDSTVFRHIFSSEAMRQVFSDENRVQCYLDIEAALAQVQARLGLIPQRAV